MTIREATDGDIDAIRRVAERSWETDYPDILTRETAEAAVSEWYDAEELRDELENSRALLCVAEREGSVVGFTHANWNDADEGYILRLYVDPDHRRDGVGRALLEETCTRLEGMGVERINAMVLADNGPGNTFYEEFGFEHVDKSETTIGGEAYPENRYVLER